MASKSKIIQLKLSEKQAELESILKMAAAAEKEEQEKTDNAKSQIDSIGNDLGVFIGVILTPADLVAILDLALKTRENVKIPYTLYFND